MNDKAWYGKQRPTEHAVCLIGSVPTDPSQPPYVHSAVFGKQAYEAWHTYHYLVDLFVHRNGNIGTPFWALDIAMRATQAENVEFVELGSSLYSAIEKLNNCAAIDPGARPRIHWLGVELSEWLCQVAQAVHPDVVISHYPTWRDLPAAAHPRFLFSQSVGNYAFENVSEYVEWSTTGRFSILRERFSLNDDVTTALMGKRYVAFSLPSFLSGMRQRGYQANMLAFRESHQCFDASVSGTFVEAVVLVHNFNDAETTRFDEILAAASNLGDPAHNMDPPLPLSVGMLRRDIAVTAEWQRDYVRAKPQGRHRFDFSALQGWLERHAAKLAALYEKPLLSRLRGFMAARRTSL